MSSSPDLADVGVGMRPLLDVIGSDLRVPVVTGGTRPFVHLDHAASAPALTSVAARVAEFLPWYSSVHRGAGFTSTISSEQLEVARERVRSFVGGRSDDTVVFTRNTTDSLNLLARALPPDTDVFTLDLEHHANLLPWRNGTVTHLPTPGDIGEVAPIFAAALRRRRSSHALVAVTGASNVTGELLPLSDIAAVAHEAGARVVVDAAQLAPHRPIEIAATGIDYIAFSGHKLHAPFGAGVLVGRPDWLDAAPPYLAGGGAVRSVSLDDVAWSTGPARHEAGTPNVVGAVAIAAACAALEDVSLAAVHRHDEALLGALLDGVAELDGVRAISAFGSDSDRVGLATLITRRPAAIVAAALSAEHAIAPRDGAFCAHPLLRRLVGAGASAGATAPVPNALRVSVGVGTTAADIATFLDALGTIEADGPMWSYELINGRLSPSPDTRPRPF